MQKLKKDIMKNIIDAAKELFIQKGYSETSVEIIASKAGISKSNFYNYFKSKEDVFFKITEPASVCLRHIVKFFMDTDIDRFISSEKIAEKISERIYSYTADDKDAVIILFKSAFVANYENELNLLKETVKKCLFKNIKADDFFASLVTDNIFDGIIKIIGSGLNGEDILSHMRAFILYHINGLKCGCDNLLIKDKKEKKKGKRKDKKDKKKHKRGDKSDESDISVD